jgi:hypothetical protein
MIVLVCGGRDYTDALKVDAILYGIHHETPITLLIHGGANGADSLAGEWAILAGVPTRVFEAQWRTYGKAAGFKRNIQMAEQDPDLVIAFPGGRGTKMMIDISKKRGLNVRVVE